MAENVVKNKIIIEGEAKYKQTLREISQSLREAKSEYKAADAALKEQGASVEAVLEKLTALGKIYTQQSEKLKTMSEQLGKVTEAYGENSREASELRTRMNNLRAEMSKTATGMRELKSQLGALGSEGDEAKSGLDGVGKSLDGLGDTVKGAKGGLGGLLGDLGKGFKIPFSFDIKAEAGKALVDFVKNSVQHGFREAVEDQRDFNMVGVKTGTVGTANNELVHSAAKGLSLRQPAVSDEDAVDMAASLWTRAAGTEYVKSAEAMRDLLLAAYTASKNAGVEFDSIVEAAKNLSAVFGGDFKDNVALIGMVGQGNGGAPGVDVLEKYALNFRKIGMNAEEAAGAINRASDAGVTDAGIFGAAIRELSTWMSVLDEDSSGAAQTMGLLGLDLGEKFRSGGEAAQAAIELVLDRLSKLEPRMRDDVGRELFGTEGWDIYGSKLADAVLQGYGQTVQEEANRINTLSQTALTDDVGSQWKRVGAIWEESCARQMEPVADYAREVVSSAADAMQEELDGGGNPARVLMSGIKNGAYEALPDALKPVADSLALTGEEVATQAEQMRSRIAEALASGDKLTAQQLIGDYGTLYGDLSTLFAELGSATAEDASAAGEQAGAAMRDAIQTQMDEATARIAELNQNIETAYAQQDPALAEAIKVERDALLVELESLQTQLNESTLSAGDGMVTGLSDGAKGLPGAAETLGADVFASLEGFTPRALEWGKAFGLEMDTGYLAGVDPIPSDAESTVSTLVEQLYSGTSEAFAAGYATGQAFERGYKAALDQHSPSRVMLRDAQDTLSPLLDTLGAGAEEVRRRGAVIGEAVHSGYREGAGNGGFAGGYGASDPTALVDALKDGLAGLAVMIDGRIAGALLEPSVSRTTSMRASGSVRGQSAAARGW